jgi:hypothetical protein
MTFVAVLIAIGLWALFFAPKKKAPLRVPEVVAEQFVLPDIEPDSPEEPAPPATTTTAPPAPQTRPKDAWPAQFNRTLYGPGLCSPRRTK